MQVMVFVKANEASEAGEMPSTEQLTRMGEFNEELVAAGIMLDGNGLHPTSKGARVTFHPGGETSVTDGPFAETKELISGYWIWQVKSLDEAKEWARRIPNLYNDESSVDIRPVFEPEDFGDEFTPELQEKEAELRQRAEQN
jgi:hypothetical protein